MNAILVRDGLNTDLSEQGLHYMERGLGDGSTTVIGSGIQGGVGRPMQIYHTYPTEVDPAMLRITTRKNIHPPVRLSWLSPRTSYFHAFRQSCEYPISTPLPLVHECCARILGLHAGDGISTKTSSVLLAFFSTLVFPE